MNDEIEALVQDVLGTIDEKDKKSPDITLFVFQRIQEQSAKFGSRYRMLRATQDSDSLNRFIAVAVKAELGRETDTEITVTPQQCTLIKTYTRFKPKL